ncbi:MAG: response regulator, partial [Chitinivibrionales bacterium]
MPIPQPIKILLVEDSPSDARLVQGILAEATGENFEVTWTDRLDTATEKLRETPFDVGLIDLGLPDSMGKNTYLSVMKTAPNLPLIVLTGLADETLGVEAIHDGVQDYLVKGSMDGRAMARSIRYAIERIQAKKASEDLQKELKRHAEELEAANKSLRESRKAALNLIEDAERARLEAEHVSAELERDIAERKKAEESLQKLNRTLKAHNKSSKVMMRAEDEKQYLKEVCKIITEDCGHMMVWIGYAENDDGKSVTPVASAGFDDGYLDHLDITWADTERGRGPTGAAI